MYPWEPAGVTDDPHQPTEVPVMGRPIAHFEILGPEPARLRSFYAGLFDWTMTGPDPADPAEYAMAYTHAGDGAIDGGIGRAPDGAPRSSRPAGGPCWRRSRSRPRRRSRCSRTPTATWSGWSRSGVDARRAGPRPPASQRPGRWATAIATTANGTSSQSWRTV